MRIAVHQPEHLPWLGFFDKLSSVDVFVILDHVAFSKNNRQNRNQIMSMHGNPIWLTVPIVSDTLKHKCISRVEMLPPSTWSRRYLENVRHSYEKDPYYSSVQSILEEIQRIDTPYLSDLNILLIRNIVQLLGIKTRIVFSSRMSVAGKKSSLLVNLCKEIGATEYVSGIGGLEYLSPREFESQGVEVKIRRFYGLPSTPLNEKGLSIIHHIAKFGSDVAHHFGNRELVESRL